MKLDLLIELKYRNYLFVTEKTMKKKEKLRNKKKNTQNYEKIGNLIKFFPPFFYSEEKLLLFY